MTTRADFADHCLELLSGIGTARARRMFGGYGIYLDDDFVAIVTGETLYLKADDQTRDRFAAAGGRQFGYTAKGDVRHSLNYWTPPADAMDSAGAMTPWARLALEAARRQAATSRKRPAKKAGKRRG